ncbi:SpaA isopeptide-forming pilin-related protein [Mediterraneibacter gnavus]|uniref:SpaA isopeptide-forming pilin-related protein n=1 Tax=Mediterraneibacter gnavus TaxID=33038 RepID=UPI0036D304C6
MKKWKRILSAALSVLLLSGSISVCAAERTYTDRSEVIGTAVVVGDEDSAGGSSLFSRPGTIATITPGKNHSYGSWGTCEFNVKTETGNHLGFCAEPNSGTPSGNFSVSILDDSIEKNANIKAAVLCYVIPELYEALGKNIYNEKDNNTYAYCHALVGYLYSGSLTGLSASMANGVKMMRDTVNAHRQTNPTLISYMQRYQVYVAYNDQQDIVWVEEQQKGSMNLKKESANPEMTDGNSCYSLEGATYGVYKEQACTTKVADLTTDAQGNSNTVEVDAGTYYVKETKAPKGFVLDKQVHPVTVTAGRTSIVKVKDIPTLDPVGVLLGKIDKETNQNKPQGSASLEGAEFTVKYYQTLSDSDPGQAGQSPERTWVFRTDEDGFCEYNTQYLVSGDELYLAPSGVPSLPLGTITIQETKAPEGYLLNSEIYVVKITSNNDGSEFVYTYNEPKIPETLLTLDIVKVLKGKDTPIPGVVFLHTDSKGNQEEVTTDEKGQAVLKGLTRGTHTIQEKSVPDGYIKNPGVLKFSVDENNKITVVL